MTAPVSRLLRRHLRKSVQLTNLALLAEAERLRSGWLNGVKHWQVD
jgi:hypothetical protein